MLCIPGLSYQKKRLFVARNGSLMRIAAKKGSGNLKIPQFSGRISNGNCHFPPPAPKENTAATRTLSCPIFPADKNFFARQNGPPEKFCSGRFLNRHKAEIYPAIAA